MIKTSICIIGIFLNAKDAEQVPDDGIQSRKQSKRGTGELTMAMRLEKENVRTIFMNLLDSIELGE